MVQVVEGARGSKLGAVANGLATCEAAPGLGGDTISPERWPKLVGQGSRL